MRKKDEKELERMLNDQLDISSKKGIIAGGKAFCNWFISGYKDKLLEAKTFEELSLVVNDMIKKAEKQISLDDSVLENILIKGEMKNGK